jgi:molecular chaperone GrpE
MSKSGELMDEKPKTYAVAQDEQQQASGKDCSGEVEDSKNSTDTADVERERDEYYDLLLRRQAEFENFKRRVNREKSEMRISGKLEVLEDLLPIIEACEKGLESMREEADSVGETYLDGYELLLKELRSVLEKHNVVEVPGVGKAFDPNMHEAVVREVTNDSAEGEILEEFRKGYQLGERLLRPSQVRVAVWPADKNEENETSSVETDGES